MKSYSIWMLCNLCSEMAPSTSTMEVEYIAEELLNVTKDMDKESVP